MFQIDVIFQEATSHENFSDTYKDRLIVLQYELNSDKINWAYEPLCVMANTFGTIHCNFFISEKVKFPQGW